MTNDPSFVIDLAQRAREFGARRDSEYTKAVAIAEDYGSLLADWHQLRADLVGKQRELLQAASQFADAGQFTDSSRLLDVASGYRASVQQMDRFRPVRP